MRPTDGLHVGRGLRFVLKDRIQLPIALGFSMPPSSRKSIETHFHGLHRVETACSYVPAVMEACKSF
jgi:hypothetical protein